MSRESKNSSKGMDRPFDKAVWDRARRLTREYRIILEREFDGFLARSIELPMVMVHGATANQCEKKMRDALCVAAATMFEEGRTPPLGVNRRAAQVNVRLTAEEKLVLEEAARQEGFKGLSDFIRHVALAHSMRPA